LTAVPADRDRHLLPRGQSELDPDEVVGIVHLLAIDVDKDVPTLHTSLVSRPTASHRLDNDRAAS
jgi:hypothetical protein